MLDAKSIPRAFPRESREARLGLILVLFYQGIAVLAFVAIPILAFNRIRSGTGDLPGSILALVYLPYLLGLIYLGSAIWVLSMRREEAAAKVFAVFACSAALTLGTFFDLLSTQALVPLWTLAVALAGASAFHLALIFPDKVGFVRRHPFTRWLAYLPALALALISLGSAAQAAGPEAQEAAWGSLLIYLALGLLFFASWIAWRRYRSPSPIARARARVLLWGVLGSFGPLALWLLARTAFPTLSFYPVVLLPLGLFPLVVGYAVLRYRLLDTDYLLSRAVVYALLTILGAAGYALLATGMSLLLGIPVAAAGANPFLIGLVVILIAFLLQPLRNRLQQAIDKAFFRGERVHQERLEDFRRALNQAVELPDIVQALRTTINDSLDPARLHIYVYDPLSDQYAATPDEVGRLTSDLRFPSSSSLPQTLRQRQAALYIAPAITLPRDLLEDWPRMSLLGAQFFIPLTGGEGLIGWLALSARRTGDPYSDQDLLFLEALNEQAARALERAQVVDDLERRVHQMNVLTRVAHGVSITSAFDDILELLYAQTNQAIKTRDFFITLQDESTEAIYNAFHLENNERLEIQENRPLLERQGLASEVIRTGRPLLTDDYARECRQRAILPLVSGVYAWMSIPLNTSDATIGAISVGSREPSQIFTADQRDILQAIADQAAGAIAKARLLEDAERRARQLATLNDIAQSLSSTLALEPLLDQILQSAVDILNCEAGSLFMVDENTAELIFQVTAGPVATDLVGQRLPPGTGLVGRAAETGQPIIANDVHRTKEWYEETDQQTGFMTQSMLVVPLQVKETTLGVLEVINKIDGSPFTLEEQELLMVFTGQAAVAIENARLYTLTDQALAARVDELSVMQRIDRELNASLELGRTLEITLDWALRQSGAAAGMVGMVEGDTFRVMASQGYTPPFEEGPEQRLSLELPLLQEAIDSGMTRTSAEPDLDPEAVLLPGARSQVAIPLRREMEVIGLFFLESAAQEGFSEETLRFLARLSDHAAIATSNAQYYAEVQAANLAKSDFVSFVSHELKTPMTSIKGYSDLLATGAVGEVNQAQANFLATIRSNVDRMATLVSDLADISRIEAGRMRLEFAAVPVGEVIDEVIRSTRRLFEEKDQTLSIDLPDHQDPVWGDRNRLIQILSNLVSNANKYTPEGGEVHLQAVQQENAWDPEGAPQVILISVTDTGIGISPEDQGKIFQKFFRSEDEKARESPGTGLGLNITKNLVEMQGGKIWFESEFRQGTTFYFTIPVAESGLGAV